MALLGLMLLGFFLPQGFTERPFNYREACQSQHWGSRYSVFCDGNSKQISNKNLFLDGRSTSGMTDIKLHSFQSITFVSRTPSDWSKLKKITISNTKNVTLDYSVTLKLQEFEIESTDELTIKMDKSAHSFDAESILLSNIGKLSLSDAQNAVIQASSLSFYKVKDVDFSGELHLSGGNLSFTECNILVQSGSTLFTRFSSLNVDNSVLYVQKGGKFNVSTEDSLIEDSQIVMEGHMSMTSYGVPGNKKVMKFLDNTFYPLGSSNYQIHGNEDEMEFVNNYISSSDINDVLNLVGGIKHLRFVNNRLSCNKCVNKLTLQSKDLGYLGGANFCYTTCNLTLTSYKNLLNKDRFCNQNEVEVDFKTLCVVYSEVVGEKSTFLSFWWILLLSIVLLVLISLALTCIFCKREPKKFPSAAVVMNPLPTELKFNSKNQQVTVLSFSNQTYESSIVSPYCENVYEEVQSPRVDR